MPPRSARRPFPSHRSGLVAACVACGLTGCTAPAPCVVIPFTCTADDNVMVHATLNGRDPVDLMFHTAVDSVSLTKAAIARLTTFAPNGSIEVRSWGGTAAARHSQGNTLQIGPLTWRDLELTESELSGPGTDGKFGPNLFAGQVVELDFDRNELRLHETLPPHTEQFECLELEERDGMLFVVGEARVGERAARTSFLLHTGFGGAALFDEQFVREHGLPTALDPDAPTLQDSYGNPVRTQRLQRTSLRLGTLVFDDVPAAVFGGQLGGRRTSVLGGTVLTRMNLVFAADRRHLYVRPNARFAAPWPTAKQGPS